MIKTGSKIQSQVPSPFKTNIGDTTMEENGNHADEITESVASEVDRQVQKHVKQLRSEIKSEIKKKKYMKWKDN